MRRSGRRALVISFLLVSQADAVEMPREICLGPATLALHISCSSTDFQTIELAGSGQLSSTTIDGTFYQIVPVSEFQHLIARLLRSTFPHLPERVESMVYWPEGDDKIELGNVEVSDDYSVALTLTSPEYSKKVEYSSKENAPEWIVSYLQRLAIGEGNDS